MDTLQTVCWSVIRSKIQKQNTEIKNATQICAVFFIWSEPTFVTWIFIENCTVVTSGNQLGIVELNPL